jgi:hypothetical protein
MAIDTRQKIMGHTTGNITQDLYTFQYLELIKKALDMLATCENKLTFSSKEYTSQKDDNRKKIEFLTIVVFFSKLLACLIIYFVVFIIGSIIFEIIKPNDHSQSSSTAKIHKGNHLPQSKLSNEIDTVKEEIRLHRLSAEKGDALRQANLGLMSSKGKVVPQDHKKAARFYQISAEQGNATGQAYLGVSYANGEGVPQDYKEAVRLYRLSAEQGNVIGQSNLGFMYSLGKGIHKSTIQLGCYV